MQEWVSALAFIVVSTLIGLSLLVFAWVFRTRAQKESPLKATTYECGEEPDGPSWIQFHPRYYVVALVFVLFDVEAVFLFPWALTVGRLGTLAIVDMVIFVVVLMLGWAYALKKGALKWQ